MNNTNENNKIITEFMGNPTIFNPIHDANLYQIKEQSNMTYYIDELQYNTSWDWLMPVVHKCRQQNRLEYFDFVYYAIEMCDINVTYKAVLEFIKNQNK
tara:strand:- start:420 stop:716 length:297 start_codon:yes stop_codon:yes gene_type:complete